MIAQILLCVSLGFAATAAGARIESRKPENEVSDEPSKINMRAWQWMSIAIVVAAAVARQTSPTGNAFLDFVYSALFAAACAIAAMRAPRVFLMISFLPVAVFAVASSNPNWFTALGTFAPFGAAIALQMGPAKAQRTRIIVSAAVALSLFWLPTDAASLIPSATAAAMFFTLTIGALHVRRKNAFSDDHPSVSKRRLFVFAGIFVVGTFLLLTVRQGLVAKRAVERAVTSLSNAFVPLEALDISASRQALTSATSDLKNAQSAVNSPLWKMASVVPISSQNIHAITALIDDAVRVTTDANELMDDGQFERLRRPDGGIDIRTLDGFGPQLESLDRSLSILAKDVRSAEGPWVVSPIKKKVVTFAPKVEEARSQVASGKRAGKYLPRLLGASTPRRYLLVFPTPSEVRGSGGLIGNFGEIEIDNGKISLTRFDRIAAVLVGGKPWQERQGEFPDGYLQRYADFNPKEYFQNLLASPDFATNAKAMASQYPEAGGRPVDGVLSVDPYGMAAILALEGPLAIEGLAEPVTSENAPKILLFDLYAQNTDVTAQYTRIALLDQIARATFDRLKSIPLGSPRTLVSTIGPAFRSRHIQMWSRDPQDQEYLASLGATGNYVETNVGNTALTDDAFGMVSQNAGGNKIDWFVSRSLDYSVNVDKAGTISAKATITVKNEAPKTGLSAYIIGNSVESRKVPLGTAPVLLSIYTKLNLDKATAFGSLTQLTKDTEFGLNVYTILLDVPSRSQQTLELTLSGKRAKQRLNAPYSLELLYQPLINLDDIKVSFSSHKKKKPVTDHLRLAGPTNAALG
jgi:hypothetical protein